MNPMLYNYLFRSNLFLLLYKLSQFYVNINESIILFITLKTIIFPFYLKTELQGLAADSQKGMWVWSFDWYLEFGLLYLLKFVFAVVKLANKILTCW